MAYFPFFVDIENKECLIVGGGMVAYRKMATLKDYGPRITVVAPEMVEEFFEEERREEGGDGRLRLERRKVDERDFDSADFVVAATADEKLNQEISAVCRRRRIPVNVVDVPKECSFIFPALVRDRDITVGISTGGDSPTIAKILKERFRAAMPEGFGELAIQLGQWRELVKERVDSQPLRSRILKEMAEIGISQGCRFSREDALRLIETYLGGQHE